MTHGGQMDYVRECGKVPERFYCTDCGASFLDPGHYGRALSCLGGVGGEVRIHGLPPHERVHVVVPGPWKPCPGCDRCVHPCDCDVCLGRAARYPDVLVPVAGDEHDQEAIITRVHRALNKALVSPHEIEVFQRWAARAGDDHSFRRVLRRWVTVI